MRFGHQNRPYIGPVSGGQAVPDEETGHEETTVYDTVQMARFYRLVKSSSLFHVIAGIP